MRLTLALCLLPCAVSAQDVSFDIAPTVECVAAGQGAECAGLAANLCMERSDAGYSTYGMSHCTDLELTWWDKRLNVAYRAARDRTAQYDAEGPDYAPSQAEALLEMQRAWISFRDAKCAFVASEWGGGSGAGPAAIWCMMDETAAQTLYLEERIQD